LSDPTHSTRGNGPATSGTGASAAEHGAHRVGGARDQALDAVHHHRVVGVRLVELEHRELGVVRAVDPLVPEVVPDLVHALEAAHDQPLEVQLVGDAQVERHVERVVVRRERPRGRAAVQRLQHRRLDLEVAEPVEERAHGRDHPRARDERAPHLGVHREVGVALPVALLGVAEPRVPHRPPVDHLLLPERQRAERLREQLDRSTRTDASPARVRKSGPSAPTTSPTSTSDLSTSQLSSPSASRRK
jgi:hypothetical protein